MVIVKWVAWLFFCYKFTNSSLIIKTHQEKSIKRNHCDIALWQSQFIHTYACNQHPGQEEDYANTPIFPSSYPPTKGTVLLTLNQWWEYLNEFCMAHEPCNAYVMHVCLAHLSLHDKIHCPRGNNKGMNTPLEESTSELRPTSWLQWMKDRHLEY